MNPLDAPSAPLQSPLEAHSGGSLDAHPDSQIQTPTQNPDSPSLTIAVDEPCVLTIQTRTARQKKIQTPSAILTYDDFALFEGIARKTIFKRAIRGLLHRIEMGRGRNGKPIWGIPLSALSEAGRRRYHQSMTRLDPEAACPQAPFAVGTAPTSGTGLAAPSYTPTHASRQATLKEHVTAERRSHTDAEQGGGRFRQAAPAPSVRHPIPGSLLAPVSPDLVPLTAGGAVDEAALLAMGRGQALSIYHKRIRAMLDLEYAQAAAPHGTRLEALARVARDHQIPEGTLRRLQATYRHKGADALVPQWGKTQGASTVPKPLRAELLAAWHTPLGLTFAQAYRYAVQWSRDRGVIAPSQYAVRRFLRKHAANPQLTIALRKGKKAHNNAHRYHMVRDPNDLPVNAVWCGDTRTVDVYVIMPDGAVGRPQLCQFLDIHSGRLVGHVAEQQMDSDGVATALYRAIVGWTDHDLDGNPIVFEPCGLPAVLYLDNGKDYNGGAMKPGLADAAAATIYNSLGIKRCNALPYQAWSKPMEAAFSAMAQDENLTCGFCGHKTDEKPEILKALAANGQLLTLDQWAAAYAAWAAERNANHVLGHLREHPPLHYYQDFAIRPADPDQLDALLCRATNRVLHKHGFHLEGFGRFMADDPRLVLLIGSRFELRYNRHDPSAIRAFHPRTGQRFIVPRIPEGNSWDMILGGQPSEQFRHAQAVRRTQRQVLSQAAAEVTSAINLKYLDSKGTWRKAAANAGAIRTLRRQLAAPDPQPAIAAESPPSPCPRLRYLAAAEDPDPLGLTALQEPPHAHA